MKTKRLKLDDFKSKKLKNDDKSVDQVLGGRLGVLSDCHDDNA